jgi:hypothetical protein
MWVYGEFIANSSLATSMDVLATGGSVSLAPSGRDQETKCS